MFPRPPPGLERDCLKRLGQDHLRCPPREREPVEYWDVIRWDATGFLMLSDSHSSRLYHGRIAPSLTRDVALFFRGLASGTARSLLGGLRALERRKGGAGLRPPAYILLLSMGTDKYASEEQDFRETCLARDQAVLCVHVSEDVRAHTRMTISVDSVLAPSDYLCVYVIWMVRVLAGIPWFFARNGRRRSLFAAVIPGIWQYEKHRAFARRVVAHHGVPRAVLSLAPWSVLSSAMVEHMRAEGVPTAGIRTQTTSPMPEMLAINTDVLFYKSPMERSVYETVFRGAGPRLEEGCILSLPARADLEPLVLPNEFALLLGTAIDDQTIEDYWSFNGRLFAMGAASSLPVVFKGHNLSRGLDEAWVERARHDPATCSFVWDVRRNRELIDRASIIVSAPSTLLYYAIAQEKPIIIVEPEISARVPDEFAAAPILRIRTDQVFLPHSLDWSTMRQSSLAARRWFEDNYHAQDGPARVLESLLELSSITRHRSDRERRNC